MKNFLSDFSDYIKSLAISHVDIAHSDEAKHYFRGEVEEFFQNLRSAVCFPCVVLESCEVEYKNGAPSFQKVRNTAFIVVADYDQLDDFSEIQNKLSLCEKIGEEFIGRIEDDNIFRIDMDSVVATYMQNQQQRYVGCRFAFSISEQACIHNTKAWR